LNEDTAWTFTIPANTFSDLDSATLTIAASLANGSPLPNWLTFDPETGTFSGTPPPDANGTVQLRVVASDGTSSVANVFTLNVVPVNDAPTVVGESVALAPIAEGTESPPGQTVSALLAGSFSDARDQVSGGSQANGFAGIAISGNAATTQGAWQYFDGANWVTIPGNVSETNALLLSTGTLLRFLPAEGFSGAAPPLTVHLVDDSAGAVTTGTFVNLAGSTGGATPYSSGTVTVNETVTAVNDPPVTTPVTLAPIAEDSGARLITQAELLSNASDPDGDALAAVNLAITSGGGSLVNNGNGTWSYTPALNDDTAVTFSYSITDGIAPPIATTATLDITPVNDAPTTTPVTLAPIAEDSGARLITQAELLSNASDVEGNGLTAINLVIAAGGGCLVNNGNGTWTYTPALNDDTSVSFNYSITDGTTPVATTATLDITPVNDAPTTTPVTMAPIAENSGARLITQAELLSNASDPDGDALTAVNLAIISGSGSLVNNGNGTWSYTPALNDDTSVTFSYSITDGTAAPVATTATLDITPVNEAPTTTPVTLAPIAEDSGARLITQAELLANASDGDGNALTAVNLAIATGGGTLLDNGNGTWNYTPALNDDTAVTFSYSITDGIAPPVATTATLDITPVNDAPIIAEGNVTFTVSEGQIGVQQGTFHATDAEGDPLTWSVVNGSPAGADYFVMLDDLSITKNGSVIFHDGFDGGGSPPSAPYFANGFAGSYFIDGTFIEDVESGRLIMTGRQGAAFISTQTGGSGDSPHCIAQFQCAAHRSQ
jgi:outer membrane lipoprotein-sorting protein